MASSKRFTATALRGRFGKLFDEVEAALFRSDPMGLNFEDNTDEYEFEARGIVPRLTACGSLEVVQDVLFAEFDPGISDHARLMAAATEIWNIMQRRSSEGGCRNRT